MTDTLQGACWKAEDAKEILATEALEGKTAVFLATHFPIEDFEVSGSQGSDLEAATEGALLEVLSTPSTRHALCVVEGEPGSGKSHLIRWLRVKWPYEEDLVLLIQRADGSLEGTLRQLQEKLPSDYQYLFEYVGRPQDLTLEGRSRVFQSNLALAMKPDHFEKALPDAEWCRQAGLSDLLGHPGLFDQWKAPERILSILSGKHGERDQELALFNLDDVAELEQRVRGLRRLDSVPALRFSRRLKDEAEGIRARTRKEKSDPSAHDELREEFPNSYRLVDALNLRLENALQNMLGISSEGLKELFLRMRRELRDRRLILLLEDITAWQGVDSTLIDVLVTNVETREDEDLCPMISVVGITPEYFRSAGFHSNYRQRITHHIRLGHENHLHQYQDVSSLRTPESQAAFAAKYLRAVRAGVERLVEWNGSDEEVPNTCHSCSKRITCHAAFGHHEGIGYFPFTKRAVTKLFTSLEDEEHRATYQTPRGMIQGVLWPTLRHPSLLDAGEYPGHETESAWVRADRRRLSGIAPSILEAQVPEERQRERLRRLIAYWGSDHEMETRSDEAGVLTYAGVSREIYNAFGLPWLGEDQATARKVTPSETPEDPTLQKGASGDREGGRRDDGFDHPKGSPQRKTKKLEGSRSKPLPRAELLNLQSDIDAWMEGKKPSKPLKLNTLAYEILREVPWRQMGISEWVWNRLFTTDTVILKGTNPARATYFVIPNDEWARNGLLAYAFLKGSEGNLDASEEETYQHRYAVLLRRLSELVEAHIRNRIPCLEGDKDWVVPVTVAQVLLARCWLRGSVSPLEPSWEQWRVLVRDEVEPTSNPQDRVDSWNELVNKTSGGHAKFRTLLYQMVNCSQGEGSTSGLSDTGLIAEAVLSMQSTMQISPFPQQMETAGKQLSELVLLSENASAVKQKLPNIPRLEVERLKSRAESIDRMARKSSLRGHITRVDDLVNAVATELPEASPAAVQVWKGIMNSLLTQGYLENGNDSPGNRVERFIDRVLDGDIPETKERAKALAWTLEAPAGELQVISKAFDAIEDTVGHLLSYVEGYIGDPSAASGSLDNVHKEGMRIQQIATSALHGLEGV